MWIEKISLNQAIDKANERYDLSRLEEPVPDEVKLLINNEIARSRFLKRFTNRISNAGSIAQLNRILDSIFDDADRNRVWCGMPGTTETNE